MSIIGKFFPKGILRPELYMGYITIVTASKVQFILSNANDPSASYYQGGRYGKGEVGEFIIIEGQVNLVLGRIIEIKTSDEDIGKKSSGLGQIQLLGSISMESLKVTAGIDSYPRLYDRIYAAPHKLVSMIPTLMDSSNEDKIVLSLGSVDVAQESEVVIDPEKLFGRHCAILGSTGGGKSWTTAKIIEESIKFNSKLILFDATGEYKDFVSDYILNYHLGESLNLAEGSIKCSLPPTSFQESDFIALFEPSGKVQGPKLREAIKSLRLVKLYEDQFPNGIIEKINQSKEVWRQCLNNENTTTVIDNPKSEFKIENLVKQINQECVYPNGGFKDNVDLKKWGNASGEFSYCLSLVTRIEGIRASNSLACVFKDTEQSLIEEINAFIKNDDKRLLRIDLSGISFEYKAREIIANVIGRHLLSEARKRVFTSKPIIVFVDEAHNFLGRNIGSEDTMAKLDAFELIAKEGRKFCLNICLSTQRPRDITEGVLSQIGTMVVHRLTNDRDRDVVEKACGEIDKAASAFLPNLKPGEAAIIGSDFPIPLTIQIKAPKITPKSAGSNFQVAWKKDVYISSKKEDF